MDSVAKTDGHMSMMSNSTENSIALESPLIFIFVNPSSGGNRANMFTSMGAKDLRFHDPGLECKVFIYDIREGESGNKEGFLNLRDQISKRVYISQDAPIRVVVAGGDGTVMWTIQETLAHNIDLAKVAFGVIPFGTGNDFARATAWGSSSPSPKLFHNGMKGFRALAKSWLEADVKDFDVWEVSVRVHEGNGAIKQVKSKQKVEIHAETKLLTKPMCNYFSIGVESRVGLGFDKKRTKSTTLNKAMYAWEGIKKAFTRTPRVTEIIDTLDAVSENRCVFSTSIGDGIPRVDGTPVSLIFLNIPSFAGGCDLWSKAKKLSLSDPSKDLLECKQSIGDGKLEILTYKSLVGLSLEQAKGTFMAGNGRRLAQETGPLQINFKPHLEQKRTYMQIDGEFFTLDNPENVQIKHKVTVKVLSKHS